MRLLDERWKKTCEGKVLVKEERLVKKAIKHTHACKKQGDMLMDIDPRTSWEDLVLTAQDRDSWRIRVRGLKLAAKATQWKEAEKTLHKQIKITATGTLQQPKSCFTYEAHCLLPATNGDNPDRAIDR